MPHKIDRAFILAAGYGTRMRPLTDTLPKPMIEIAGKAMIDHTLEKLDAAEVQDVTVNTHHLAPVLEKHLKGINRPRVTISHESELLETGGGVKKALSTMYGRPFYLLGGDSYWTDGPYASALDRLSAAWDGERMDILLLLQPVDKMTLTYGVGDYDIHADGRIVRSKTQTGSHMFTSIRITSPNIFEETSDGPFSYLQLMDEAEKRGRLYGLVHDGDWHHLSTPEDVSRVNDFLTKGSK